MSDKELWELMSIICEGQDSEQRREVEQYITDLQKEIERLNKELEQYKYSADELNEIERLNNIIKEVRKYIETEYLLKFDDFERPLRMTDKDDWNKLLEILDKENK